MTKQQRQRIETLLKGVQDLRRAADKEAAKGINGVGAFSCSMQLDEAIWGLVYAEKSIAALFDKEEWAAGLTKEQRSSYGLEK